MATHITIGDISPRVQYTGDGSTVAFTYPFPIFKDADMEVFEDGALKTLTTDYTVSGAGNSSGGTVTFVTAPASGVVVTLRRNVSIERTSDFQESGEFRAKVINDELDAITAVQQQLDDAIDRSIRLADADQPAALTLPDKAARADKVLLFDSNGGVVAGNIDSVSTTNPTYTGLTVTGKTTITNPASGAAQEIRGRSVDDIAELSFTDNAGTAEYADIYSTSTMFRLAAQNNNVMAFYTGGSERVRIDSAGKLYIGTTAGSGGSEQVRIITSGGGPAARFEASSATYTGTLNYGVAANSGTGFSFLKYLSGNGATTEFSVRGDGLTYMKGGLLVGVTSNSGGNETVRFYKSDNFQVARIENANASFTSRVINLTVAAAASTAYQFAAFYSGNGADIETKFLGDGNNYCDGAWTGGGADYAEYFEWADGNPANEDRRGVSVVLAGDKIRQALTGETPFGVISGNPSVVGDAAWNKWSEKYLRDDFGTYVFEDYEAWEWTETVTVKDAQGNDVAKTVPRSYAFDAVPAGVTVPANKTVTVQQRRKLNPVFDPALPYTPRAERPEWDAVGLMGKLRIRKGEVVAGTWIKMRDISLAVEEWLVR